MLDSVIAICFTDRGLPEPVARRCGAPVRAGNLFIPRRPGRGTLLPGKEMDPVSWSVQHNVGYGQTQEGTSQEAAKLAWEIERASGQSLSIAQRLDLEALCRERLGLSGMSPGGLTGYDLEQEARRILDG